MKRVIAIVLALTLVFALSACGRSSAAPAETPDATQTPVMESTPQPAEAADQESTSNEQTSEGKILVVYFSRTGEQYNVGVIEHGNTAIVAEAIIAATGADVLRSSPRRTPIPQPTRS